MVKFNLDTKAKIAGVLPGRHRMLLPYTLATAFQCSLTPLHKECLSRKLHARLGTSSKVRQYCFKKLKWEKNDTDNKQWNHFKFDSHSSVSGSFYSRWFWRGN